MINKKILVTISVILIYVSLFALFIYLANRSHGCSYKTPCIHFCSSDRSRFSDEYLIDEFMKSKSAKDYVEDEAVLKAIRGAPSCGEMTDWLPNDEVNSTKPPYDFNFYGDVTIDDEKYSVNRYCIEKSEDFYDGWKLKTCYQDYYIQKGFHFLAIFLSVSLLGVTLFIYTYFKELRDFYGKTIIALTSSQIVAYASIPVFRYLSSKKYSHRNSVFLLISMLIISLVFILLWITVMIVHLFFTFKNFKDKTSNSYEFSTYSIFVFSFGLFSTIVFVDSIFNYNSGLEYLFFMYFIIVVLDIILFIITGVKMLMISRQLEHSEQARFDSERKWFWIVLKMTLVMLITWPFELYLWSHKFDVFGDTTGDFINLLTATTIMLMLVGREKARILLFGKYREVNDMENDAED
ncbi:hypothetical protein ACKWTF_008964 [Chironomus riparius]